MRSRRTATRTAPLLASVLALVALGAAPNAHANSGAPTFSGKNGRIAFSRPTDAGGGRIFTVKPNGRDKRFVVDGFAPQFTPDGAAITFTRQLPPEQLPRSGRFLTPTSGGEVSVHRPGYAGPTGSISPDFTHVAVREEETFSTARLTLVRADGTSPVLVGEGAVFNEIAWSPDSSRVAFSRCEPSSESIPGAARCKLQIANADGSGLRTLPVRARAPRVSAWSADGKWISYETGGAIFKVRASNNKQRKLAEKPKSVPNAAPIFSPDGRRIAFNGKKGSIWTAGRNGERPERVAHTRRVPLAGSITWQARPAK